MMRLKKGLLVAVSLCVTATIALGGVALADAASTPAPSATADAQRPGKGHGLRVGGNLNIAAALLGKTEDALRAELQGGSNLYTMLQTAGKLDAYRAQVLEQRKTKLDEAVAAGKIDRTQADERYEKARQAIDAWDGTQGAAWGKGEHDRFMGHASPLTTAASVLGMTEDELRAKVQSGSTLGALLTSAGKLDAFKAAYLQSAKADLAKAVTAGTLTQAQADARYARMEARMQAWDGTGNMGKGDGEHGGKGGRRDRTDTSSSSSSTATPSATHTRAI